MDHTRIAEYEVAQMYLDFSNLVDLGGAVFVEHTTRDIIVKEKGVEVQRLVELLLGQAVRNHVPFLRLGGRLCYFQADLRGR